MSPYRIGIDVGGMSTDLVLARPDGTIALAKSPTTPDDQSRGVLDGIALLADGEGLALKACWRAPAPAGRARASRSPARRRRPRGRLTPSAGTPCLTVVQHGRALAAQRCAPASP